MENLAYDAILGRTFLQEHRAVIDLDNSSITLKRAGRLRERASTTTVPVMGTFLPQKNRSKEKKEVDPEPCPKVFDSTIAHGSQLKNKGIGFIQTPFVLMLIILYLLTASHARKQDNDQPVIQKTQRFFIHQSTEGKFADGVPSYGTPVSQVNPKERYKSDQNEFKPQRSRVLKYTEHYKEPVDVQTISVKSLYASKDENSISQDNHNNRVLNNQDSLFTNVQDFRFPGLYFTKFRVWKSTVILEPTVRSSTIKSFF